MSPILELVMDRLMSTADELKSTLAMLSDQVDAERAAHIADTAAVATVRDANEAALVEALREG